MCRKILPINNNPIISSWQWHATLFSILQDDPYAKQWIFSNYIQLRLVINRARKKPFYFLDFIPGDSSIKYCPYLLAQPLFDIQIKKMYSDINESIIKSIESEMYIYGIIDEGVIEGGQERYLHEIFIYGYDKYEKMFYTKDFAMKNGKYEMHKISFDNFIKAYNNVGESDSIFKYLSDKHKRGLYLLSRNTNSLIYKDDLALSKCLLFEYLNSQNTHIHNRLYWQKGDNNQYVYGVSIYEKLCIFLDEHNWMETYDIRPFHVLYDHKVLMMQRLNYFYEKRILKNSDIINKFMEVVINTRILRNLYIKSHLKKSDIYLTTLKQMLMEIRNDEVQIYNSIIKELNNVT